jgi:hypothetical protein
MLYGIWFGVGWVALSMLAADLARDKGRSFSSWLLLALFFSPFVALLALCAAVPVAGPSQLPPVRNPPVDSA